MTRSDVAATEASASRQRRWRRPAWLTAGLVIAIVALLSWPRESAVGAMLRGHEGIHPVLSHVVAANEAPAMRLQTQTATAPRARVQRTGLCAWNVQFCKYRGLYRQVGFPFLVLSVIALPGWVLFRLYRRRTLGRPLSARRELLLLTFVVYLLCLATLTLTPNGSSRLRAQPTLGVELLPNPASLTCSSASLPSAPNARLFCVQNAAGNVALFFPLGILLPLVWMRLRFRSALGIAVGVSVTIELVQLLSRVWGTNRSVDVNDVILNSLGACLGLVVVFLLRLRSWTRPAMSRA